MSKQKSKHSKERLLRSNQFTPQEKDWLAALLQDGQSYSIEEAAKLLNQHFKKEAK